MIRHPIQMNPDRFPAIFRPYVAGSPIYNSSCSAEAAVYYIEKDCGYYLKTAAKGSLAPEVQMTRFFHQRQLSAEVLCYESAEQDWLLTAKLPGEDCTNEMYLADPQRLCDTTAALLRMLHSHPTEGCPIHNRTESYIKTAERNHRLNRFDTSLFPDSWRFSGFIDLGCGGIGDRHIDVFWGIWTLQFNLKTSRYTERFLDAYGREDLHPEALRTIAAIESFA